MNHTRLQKPVHIVSAFRIAGRGHHPDPWLRTPEYLQGFIGRMPDPREIAALTAFAAPFLQAEKERR
jgi:hypothetical protein